MDDQTTKELISGQARIEQMVSDMHTRLFGNGQPGVIQYLNGEIVSIKARQDKAEKDATVLTWKLGTMSAVAGSILTGVGAWLGKKFLGL